MIKVFAREPIEVGADGLFGIRKSMCKLYVPAGSKRKYKRHAEWGEFYSEGPDGYDNIVEFGSAITARNAGKFYGDAMPKLGYSISGDMVTEVFRKCGVMPTSILQRAPMSSMWDREPLPTRWWSISMACLRYGGPPESLGGRLYSVRG